MLVVALTKKIKKEVDDTEKRLLASIKKVEVRNTSQTDNLEKKMIGNLEERVKKLQKRMRKEMEEMGVKGGSFSSKRKSKKKK